MNQPLSTMNQPIARPVPKNVHFIDRRWGADQENRPISNGSDGKRSAPAVGVAQRSPRGWFALYSTLSLASLSTVELLRARRV